MDNPRPRTMLDPRPTPSTDRLLDQLARTITHLHRLDDLDVEEETRARMHGDLRHDGPALEVTR